MSPKIPQEVVIIEEGNSDDLKRQLPGHIKPHSAGPSIAAASLPEWAWAANIVVSQGVLNSPATQNWLRETLPRVSSRRSDFDSLAWMKLLRGRFLVVRSDGDSPDKDIEIRRLAAEAGVNTDVKIIDRKQLATELDHDPVRSRAKVHFTSYIRQKLERWRRVDRPGELFAPRNQLLTDLALEVDTAAVEDQTPAKATPVLPWCDRVFATCAYLKGFRVLFQAGYRSEFVTPTPLRVALAPGLLAAVLVEVWAHAMGNGGGDVLADPPRPPTCEITPEPKSGTVRLAFTPVEESSLRATLDGQSSPFAASLYGLWRIGYCRTLTPAGTFDLHLPAAPGE